MGLLSYFREKISPKKEETSVNESSATDIDTSYSKATIKDNLSNVFSNSGLYVLSALKGNVIPAWAGTQITYPFVGIMGYSDREPLKPIKSREVGRMNDFFGTLYSDSDVRSAMYSVVGNGGFDPNSYIFYPHLPIETLGTGRNVRSLNVFFPSNRNAAIQQSLGKNAVQQCLDFDENGDIVVNGSKRPSTIFYSPNSNSTVTSDGSALGLVKITVDDLVTISENMGGKKELADALNLAFRSYVSMVKNIVDRGGDVGSEKFGLDNSDNPTAGRFFDFFKEIYRGVTDELLVQQIRKNPNVILAYFSKWLESSDVRTICDKFIRKYYFPTVFEKTYCMKYVSDVKKSNGVIPEDVDRDYAIYRKCVENPSSDAAIGIIASAKYGRGQEMSSVSNVTSVMANNGMLELSDMKSSIMKVCRLSAQGSDRSVYCFGIRNDTNDIKRDFNTETTRHMGTKRVFLKIDTALSKRVQNLDYTELFERFRNHLDKNAPKEFSFIRINGEMETYAYDDEIESSVTNENDDISKNLYNAYHKNGKKIDEPCTLSLAYFIDGDFISDGYQKADAMYADMGSHKIPEILRENRYGVTEDRIRSSYFYSDRRVNFINGTNDKYARIMPKKHGLHRRWNKPKAAGGGSSAAEPSASSTSQTQQ